LNTQTTIIRKHLLKVGFITSREASAFYGIDRVAARIHELRAQGLDIKTIRVQGRRIPGKRRKSYAKYVLFPDHNQSEKG